MHCQIKTNRTMNWSDKLQEFHARRSCRHCLLLQAELYAKIIDYLNENGDNDYIRYDREKDEIYFKVNYEWIVEYEADIFDVVDIADELDIRC